MDRFQERARGLHLAVLVLVLGALLTALLGVLNTRGALPGSLRNVAELLTVCPYHSLTGRDCPLCGTLRALALLLAGDLDASWRLNPLALVFLPTAVAQLGYRAIRVIRPALRWKEEAAVISLGLLPVLGVMVGIT